MEENYKKEFLIGIQKDQSKNKRGAAKRRQIYEFISIPKSSLSEYESQGWEYDKELKTKTKVKRVKQFDIRLENRLWLLLFKLGYPELNHDRSFKILLERKGSEPLYKQIDVFARDSETVIVAECKASEKLKKRSLQKDIEEFANLKGPISKTIKKHYGKEFNPKIIWLFVTDNIIWSKPDKERAAGENLQIITERELRYYGQIAEHLGSSARYQFLAEFLTDQKIPELSNITVPAIRGKLGGKNFYCFVTTPKDLLKISYVNHRSLDDPEGAPSYQRLISRTRMKQISKYLISGGFFPTNILLNFTRKVRFDSLGKELSGDGNITFGKLHLPDRYRSAWIIDGQHRLYGFANLSEELMNQSLVVIAFDDLTHTEEANLFVTINHEQKTVPKTLLDDLEGELKWGSKIPTERIGAISARLIGALNSDVGEPIYRRVTQQGIPATDKTCLTVPALKDGLRRSGLLGKAIAQKKIYEPGPFSGMKDSETLDRARTALNSFFRIIMESNVAQWELGRKGYLCTNVAMQAYLLLFSSLIKYMEANKGLNPIELTPDELILEVEEYLEPIITKLTVATDAEMEELFKVQYGSGGPVEYYFRLCSITKKEISDFEPDGMEEWEAERSEERIESADKKLKDINIFVQSNIFRIFKEKYGEEKDAYWNKGVIDKKIKTKAYEKSLDDDDEDRLPLENYLDFLEYKKIVENKIHWPLFKPLFDIPEPGEKGYSKNLQWMERINELRRIPAHATEKRHYKINDFEYIDWIYEELNQSLKSYTHEM